MKNKELRVKIIFFIYLRYSLKEMSFCHKLKMYNPYICATQCRTPLIFQTMNFVRSKGQSLKYLRFTSSSSYDIGTREFEFVEKPQILCV